MRRWTRTSERGGLGAAGWRGRGRLVDAHLATKQMTHFAKMLAQSLPLMEKGESSGSGKKSQMSNKERQELKELRKFRERHQSNKKGGKNEDE